MCLCRSIIVCLLYLPVFNQGEEGTSWYIIQKGSVNVVIYGKVCLWAHLNAFIHLHAHSAFDTWALVCFSASFDNISSVCNGLIWVAHVCMEQTSSNCPVGLGNTSRVWQTLLSSLWLITMMKWLKGLYAYMNTQQHTSLQPVYTQTYCTFIFICMHTHRSHTYIQVHTCTLHTHTQRHRWFIPFLTFLQGLRWLANCVLCLCVFVFWWVFAYVCNHAYVCLRG